MKRRGFAVVLTRRAAKQIAMAEAWWRKNSPSVADEIAQEVERIILLLKSMPALGAPVAHPRIAGMRRVLLDRIEYHLYYALDSDQARVTLHAFWHVKRKPPRF